MRVWVAGWRVREEERSDLDTDSWNVRRDDDENGARRVECPRYPRGSGSQISTMPLFFNGIIYLTLSIDSSSLQDSTPGPLTHGGVSERGD